MLLCHSLVYQQRCQKTSSMGPLQCLAMKHLSPNAFKWFPRAGKMWVFGREDDPFPSFGSLPQMEVLLGGISADGGNRGCTKPFGELSFHAVWVAEPCFDHFSPINRSGLHLSYHIQIHSNQHIVIPLHTDLVVDLLSWVCNHEP